MQFKKDLKYLHLIIEVSPYLRPQSLKGSKMSYLDWGALDLTAAIEPHCL